MKVWEDAIVEDNTLNVHVRRLREKIEKNPNNPCYIKTERGVGYIFEAGRSAEAELPAHVGCRPEQVACPPTRASGAKP